MMSGQRQVGFTPAQRTWLIAFVVGVCAVYGIESAIVRSFAFRARPDLLSAAIAVDLIVVVPLAYWLCIVRAGGAGLRSVLVVVVLSVIGARYVLPPAHRGIAGAARYLTFAIELWITGYAIWRVRQVMRAVSTGAAGADVVDLLQRALAGPFGRAAWIPAVTTELATFYYAAGGNGDRAPDDATAFPLETSNARTMLLGFGLVLAIETPIAHLLVARWSAVVTAVLTLLGVYSLIWLIGDYRATMRRPVLLLPTRLAIRVGLRYRVDVPLEDVAGVAVASWRDAGQRNPETLNTARPASPNVVIEFRAPRRVTGIFGITRVARRIGLRLRDPAGFQWAVAARREAYLSPASGADPSGRERL
jgi:hypothetical protein